MGSIFPKFPKLCKGVIYLKRRAGHLSGLLELLAKAFKKHQAETSENNATVSDGYRLFIMVSSSSSHTSMYNTTLFSAKASAPDAVFCNSKSMKQFNLISCDHTLTPLKPYLRISCYSKLDSWWIVGEHCGLPISFVTCYVSSPS